MVLIVSVSVYMIIPLGVLAFLILALIPIMVLSCGSAAGPSTSSSDDRPCLERW